MLKRQQNTVEHTKLLNNPKRIQYTGLRVICAQLIIFKNPIRTLHGHNQLCIGCLSPKMKPNINRLI